MNEMELRVQLWDSYRLARIILGEPLESLKWNKVVLQAIQKVAEDKLEQIRLMKLLDASDRDLKSDIAFPNAPTTITTVAQPNDQFQSLKIDLQAILSTLQQENDAEKAAESLQSLMNKFENLPGETQVLASTHPKPQSSTMMQIHSQHTQLLQSQIDSYQLQVEQQQDELVDWRDKYTHLESLAVTPRDAQELLDDYNPHDPNLHTRVRTLLHKCSQLQKEQEKQRQQWKEDLQQAEEKQRLAKESLYDYQLQHQMLLEDTAQAIDWWQQMSVDRSNYHSRLSQILEKEEACLLEMEQLEWILTNLAFQAVQMEDEEELASDNRQLFATELEKLQQSQDLGYTLQEQVREYIAQQRQRLGDIYNSAWIGQTPSDTSTDGSENNTPMTASDANLLPKDSLELHELVSRQQDQIRSLQNQVQALQRRNVVVPSKSDSTESTYALSEEHSERHSGTRDLGAEDLMGMHP